MKPQKVTIEGELLERKKAMCDIIVERATTMMSKEVEAPLSMIIDRMITFAAAQGCVVDGSPHTAEAFRLMAKRIDDGLFHSVTGEGEGRH